jgi:hypothetical protein
MQKIKLHYFTLFFSCTVKDLYSIIKFFVCNVFKLYVNSLTRVINFDLGFRLQLAKMAGTFSTCLSLIR